MNSPGSFPILDLAEPDSCKGRSQRSSHLPESDFEGEEPGIRREPRKLRA